MKKSALLLLLALSSLSFFLGGCGAPQPLGRQVMIDDGGNAGSSDLSAERIAELRQAFIGRTFVFKEDWYEYAHIDSDPLGGFSDPAPITNFSEYAESRGYRRKVASAGTAAKITGMRTFYEALAFICETESGEKAYIYIFNYRPWTIFFGHRNTGAKVQRQKLDDDRITVAWIERNLTYHTMEFVENLPEVPAADLALPAPPQQPALTPAPMGAGSAATAPSIGRFAIQADPPLVHNNQMLQLVLDYEVQSAGRGSVPVTETRTLLLDGKTLPNYPKITSEARGNGRHTTSFQQLIPPRARAGTYVYQGEVCIADDCVSRSKKFQVAP
jgi:hypothetical protein